MTTSPHFSREFLEQVSAVVPEDMLVHVSDQELERRWTAVRRAMDDQRIDVLLAYGDGYSRWFTDIENTHPVNPHVMCALVIFPRDDQMTLVSQGAPGDVMNPPGRRGVKRAISWPTGGAAPSVQYYEAEGAEKALEPYANATIGIVGAIHMSSTTLDHVRSHFPKATFVDASEMVDAIKVVKSEEELALVRRSAQVHDEAMEAVFTVLRPGLMICQVIAVAEFVLHRHGSTMGSVMIGSSGPQGSGAVFTPRHSTKTVQAGDQFQILVECYGPGGMWTELGRTCVIGKADPQTREEVAFSVEAQKYTAAMLRPGMPGDEIWEAHNKFMREHDRPEETRLYCHGQGYDLVERPLVRWDDPMKIEKNMNITIHPGFTRNGYRGYVCDNFIVGDGGVERIHRFPQELIEIG